MELAHETSDVDRRETARRQFALDIDLTARAAAWTDEQAAVALTGFPWVWRDRLAHPAFMVTHGVVRGLLRDMRSGDAAPRSPAAWLAWAAQNGIAPPIALREAVERATPEASGNDDAKPPERTSDSKRTRRDRLADELDDAAAELGGSVTPNRMWQCLCARAGKSGSCIASVERDTVIWLDVAGARQTLTRKALRSRMSRMAPK